MTIHWSSQKCVKRHDTIGLAVEIDDCSATRRNPSYENFKWSSCGLKFGGA